GLPLALVEAAACAKPIVAYRIPGVDEVIVDGRTGFLTPPSVPALVDAVRRLLTSRDLREQFGTGGRDHVVRAFSLAGQVAAVQDIYDELLGSPGRRPGGPWELSSC